MIKATWGHPINTMSALFKGEGSKIERKVIRGKNSDDMLEGMSKISKQSADIQYGRFKMALFETAQGMEESSSLNYFSKLLGFEGLDLIIDTHLNFTGSWCFL